MYWSSAHTVERRHQKNIIHKKCYKMISTGMSKPNHIRQDVAIVCINFTIIE